MATSDPLPHGPNVLDPMFQRMCACGLAPREAQGRILEVLKREELVILRHVAAGAWSLEQRQFATREEAVQAEQKARAAFKKYDLDTASAIVYEQSPSPDGIIEPIVPEIWGVTVILAIRDGHLVIEFLAPTFPPESYTFAIATPKAVDELLAAAASSVHASSAAVSPNLPVPEPQTPSPPTLTADPAATSTLLTPAPVATEPSSPQTASAAESSAPAPEPAPNTESPLPEPVATRAEPRPRPELTENELTGKKLTGKETEIIEVLKRIRFPDGDVPPDITQAELIRSKLIPSNTTSGKLRHLIDDRYKEDAKAKSKATGRKETPRNPPSWPTCKRLLVKFKRLLPKQRST